MNPTYKRLKELLAEQYAEERRELRLRAAGSVAASMRGARIDMLAVVERLLAKADVETTQPAGDRLGEILDRLSAHLPGQPVVDELRAALRDVETERAERLREMDLLKQNNRRMCSELAKIEQGAVAKCHEPHCNRTDIGVRHCDLTIRDVREELTTLRAAALRVVEVFGDYIGPLHSDMRRAIADLAKLVKPE